MGRDHASWRNGAMKFNVNQILSSVMLTCVQRNWAEKSFLVASWWNAGWE